MEPAVFRHFYEWRRTGRSRWRKDPKVPKGYMMLGEVQNGVHELLGTPYQYYELLQIATERRKE